MKNIREKKQASQVSHGSEVTPLPDDTFLPGVVGGEGGGGISAGGPSTRSGSIEKKRGERAIPVDDRLGYQSGEQGTQDRQQDLNQSDT